MKTLETYACLQHFQVTSLDKNKYFDPFFFKYNFEFNDLSFVNVTPNISRNPPGNKQSIAVTVKGHN